MASQKMVEKNAPLHAPPNSHASPILAKNPNPKACRRLRRISTKLVVVLPPCPTIEAILADNKAREAKLRAEESKDAVLVEGKGPDLRGSLRKDVRWRRLGLWEGWFSLRAPWFGRGEQSVACSLILGRIEVKNEKVNGGTVEGQPLVLIGVART